MVLFTNDEIRKTFEDEKYELAKIGVFCLWGRLKGGVLGVYDEVCMKSGFRRRKGDTW